MLMFMLFAFFSMASFAQTATPEKTDTTKDIDVVKVYEQVVKEGYGTAFIYKKLANAYYFKSEYKNAKKWFEALSQEGEITDPDLKFRYAQSIKAVKANGMNYGTEVSSLEDPE
ncbi:hypothetical protein ULVI_04400 [Cochleicola gelatinilyticus]|uniref:Cell envelope biogenesis protein OmpA n=2 Tax=Cochleicola gelatinilyticus TaxID=1763537 RepID=A0A167ISY6_9FLAO|nr:hypothetical protein ULVI_04400 [Cochleicola gelatinilyticus]